MSSEKEKGEPLEDLKQAVYLVAEVKGVKLYCAAPPDEEKSENDKVSGAPNLETLNLE